jgi:phosphoserine aminotransferase
MEKLQTEIVEEQKRTFVEELQILRDEYDKERLVLKAMRADKSFNAVEVDGQEKICKAI